MALTALWQQKVRTTLTTVGVVVGTFVLVLCLSIGTGVQGAVLRQLRQHDQLRKINVTPGLGNIEADMPPEELRLPPGMSEAKRARLRESIVRRWSYRHSYRHPLPSRMILTRERLRQLAALDHVEAVTPSLAQPGWARFGDRDEEVQTCAGADGNRHFRSRLIAGDYFEGNSGRSVLVSEYLAYRWGFAGDEDVNRLIGQKVRLQYRSGPHAPQALLSLLNVAGAQITAADAQLLEKLAGRLPRALEAMELTAAERESLQRLLQNHMKGQLNPSGVVNSEVTVRGILRETTKEDMHLGWFDDYFNRDADVVLPVALAEELFFQIPAIELNGIHSVTLTVDREENVRAVSEEVRGLGLNQFSLVELAERVRLNLLMITFATGFIALVALLVAALGITNTMVMSVLERTHEIGVLKAVGARDWHIQLTFLVEGALIGAIGGALGLLGSWLASIPGDAVARSIMEKQEEIKVEQTLFVFPLWLTLGVPLFAVLITTLAAVYPARRAARVDPIAALRHE
jgi:putative ABC transport system permease protein